MNNCYPMTCKNAVRRTAALVIGKDMKKICLVVSYIIYKQRPTGVR